MNHVFLLLWTCNHFYWIADIMNFTFLVLVAFVFLLLFSDTVSLLRNNLILLTPVLRFMSTTRTVIKIGLIIFHHRGKIFLEILPNAVWIMRFSILPLGNRHCSRSYVNNRLCFRKCYSFSPQTGSFPTYMHLPVLCWILKVNPLQVSLLWFTIQWSLVLCLPSLGDS